MLRLGPWAWEWMGADGGCRGGSGKGSNLSSKGQRETQGPVAGCTDINGAPTVCPLALEV